MSHQVHLPGCTARLARPPTLMKGESRRHCNPKTLALSDPAFSTHLANHTLSCRPISGLDTSTRRQSNGVSLLENEAMGSRGTADVGGGGARLAGERYWDAPAGIAIQYRLRRQPAAEWLAEASHPTRLWAPLTAGGCRAAGPQSCTGCGRRPGRGRQRQGARRIGYLLRSLPQGVTGRLAVRGGGAALRADVREVNGRRPHRASTTRPSRQNRAGAAQVAATLAPTPRSLPGRFPRHAPRHRDHG